MWLLIILTVIIAICVHILIISPYGYWKKRGLAHPKPYPFVGNLGLALIMKKTMGTVYQEIYNDFKDYLYVGAYKARKPVIVLRDPELIKDITVKNFSNFHDNESFVDEKIDPVIAKNPFFLKGNRWKTVRTQVTLNITTGKIKNMFYLMTNVGKNLVEYLRKNPNSDGDDGIETKELAAKFTTDVVAACAFGLEGRNFIEEDSEFRKMGRKMLAPGFWQGLKLMTIFFFPALNTILRIKFLPKDAEAWFTNILMDTIKFRRENKVVRNDYLDMVMSLQDKSQNNEFTDIDVMALALTFYVDGFETSSIALSFTLFEIASHPEVQKRVQDEVDAVLKKYNGEITYDAIQEMSYLDMVLSETLRMYPPGEILMKECTADYKFPPPKSDGSGEPIDVPVGMGIVIPVKALHYDPEYFPNPNEFDPERFTEENKQTRPKHSYLPFGDGPRQCLGFRFALAQIKAALVSVISNFDLKVSPKTQLPLKLDPTYIMPAAIGGLWINYHKREK